MSRQYSLKCVLLGQKASMFNWNSTVLGVWKTGWNSCQIQGVHAGVEAKSFSVVLPVTPTSFLLGYIEIIM
jgi:hypothetical protein